MPLTVKTYPDVREAARALQYDRGARYFGGGTVLMRALNEGDLTITAVVRTADPALRRIRAEGDRLVLGASVTMAQIVGDRDAGFLGAAARLVGGPAVRSAATVGGNLFAPHPYGDLTVALLALDGIARVQTGSGEREVPLEELLRGRERRGGELVTAVSVRRPREAGAFRFLKVSRVKPKGVSVMSIAAHLPVQNGRLAGPRVAYGAMADTPLRVVAVERALDGRALDESGITEALRAATDGLEPPTDALASAWYRREVAPVHLKRLLLGRQ